MNPFNLASADAETRSSFANLKPVSSFGSSEKGREHASSRKFMLDTEDGFSTPRTPSYQHHERGSGRGLSCGRAFALATLCCVVSCTATVFLVRFVYPTSTPVGEVKNTCSKDTPEADRARKLTAEYFTARKVNDVDHLKQFFAPKSRINVNLDNAGLILTMRIRQAVGEEMIGPIAATRYYKAFPSEKHDPPANVEALVCSGNVCTNTAVLSRSIVGDFKEVSILQWDFSTPNAELLAVDVRISAA